MFNETRYRWMHKNYLYIILIVTVCSSPENWPLLNFPFHWIVTKERSQKQKDLRYVHFSTRWKKLETIVIRGLIRSLLDRCTGWNFIIPRRMDICSTLDDRSISFSFLLIFCLSSPLPRLREKTRMGNNICVAVILVIKFIRICTNRESR